MSDKHSHTGMYIALFGMVLFIIGTILRALGH